MGVGSKFLATGAIISGLVVFGPASCTASYKSIFDNPEDESWHTLFARDFTRFSADILGAIGSESKDILEEQGLRIPDLTGKEEAPCTLEDPSGCDPNADNSFEKIEPN